MHCRSQIRKAVIQQLVADMPVHTVVDTRVTAFEQAKLPAVSVYAEDENVIKSNINGTIERNLTMRVEVYRSGKTVVDDLDTDLETIEASVLNALSTLELMDEPLLDRTEFTVSDESNKRLGAVRCEYTVKYRTDPSNPSLFVE